MKKFEHELESFRQRLVSMGNLAEKMIRQATEMLLTPNRPDAGGQIVAEEQRLDAMQLEIDKEAIRLLTVYSPVASDLRMIMSISRITADIERIGDHAMNICEGLNLIGSGEPTEFPPAIVRMANIVGGMVHDALNAFSQSDITVAQSTIASDNIVDALNDQIMGDLLHMDVFRDMMKGATDMSRPLAQLLIARSMERVADQATNICEEVVYMVKGHDIRHQD